MAQNKNATEKATFAAGCFWGVEAAFRELEGVVSTRVGYTGGTADKPTYESVCTDKTGHAEAVEVEYDPHALSYEKLLDVFWNAHDPTSLNRQGPDIGTQYRSAIFFHSSTQQAAALDAIEAMQLSKKFLTPIVTQVQSAQTFHPAEEYHQQYFEKQGIRHCVINKNDKK